MSGSNLRGEEGLHEHLKPRLPKQKTGPVHLNHPPLYSFSLHLLFIYLLCYCFLFASLLYSDLMLSKPIQNLINVPPPTNKLRSQKQPYSHSLICIKAKTWYLPRDIYDIWWGQACDFDEGLEGVSKSSKKMGKNKIKSLPQQRDRPWSWYWSLAYRTRLRPPHI